MLILSALPFLLPLSFLLLQAMLLAMPTPVSIPAAYIAMIVAPLLAAHQG